jgi:hypothetical protein
MKTIQTLKKTKTMKTLKFIPISFALIFSVLIHNAYAQGPISSKDPLARKITYVVKVDHPQYLVQTGYIFQVVMTDEAGAPVAPAQLFTSGKTEYVFYENGTVHGTRTARIMKLPVMSFAIGIPPASQTGVFRGGYSYLFVINPLPSIGEESTINQQ